jgi:hypothetical protein
VRPRWLRAFLSWGLGPLAVLSLTAALGHAVARQNQFFTATSSLSPAQLTALESVPALAVANVTWALGNATSVKKMLRYELDRLPESDGKGRARALLRFAIMDSNPEGQAALFGQACALDPTICNDTKAAVMREVEARLAAPGNRLPVYFIPGHPRIPSE